MGSGVEVTALTPDDDEGGRWVGTGTDVRHAHHVVVATGMFNRPAMPDWPGRDAFRGTVLHAARYRNPAPFRGRDVLVVGAGSTGFEIAHDLLCVGADRVQLSVRTPPHVLPRVIGGLPSDLPIPLLLHLPTDGAVPAAAAGG